MPPPFLSLCASIDITENLRFLEEEFLNVVYAGKGCINVVPLQTVALMSQKWQSKENLLLSKDIKKKLLLISLFKWLIQYIKWKYTGQT